MGGRPRQTSQRRPSPPIPSPLPEPAACPPRRVYGARGAAQQMRRACRALGPASAGPAGGFGSGHGGGGPSQPSCFPITPRPIRAYTHSPACQHRSPRSFAHQPPRRRMPRRSASDTAVFTAAAARAARIPQGRPATRLPAPHSSPPPGAVLGRDRGSRTSGAS